MKSPIFGVAPNKTHNGHIVHPLEKYECTLKNYNKEKILYARTSASLILHSLKGKIWSKEKPNDKRGIAGKIVV